MVWLLVQPADFINGERPQRIDWDAEAVVDQDGDTLLSIEAFPDEVQVSEEASFGSSERFTGASLSPDERWMAITTVGSAHTFGWLYELDTEEKHPVDFQYGGSIDLGPWSPDANFIAFLAHSPAEITTIKLVDRREIGEYVDDTGFQIQIPEEENLSPPFAYEIEEWQAPHTLCFTLEGVQRCIDAETQEFVDG